MSALFALFGGSITVAPSYTIGPGKASTDGALPVVLWVAKCDVMHYFGSGSLHPSSNPGLPFSTTKLLRGASVPSGTDTLSRTWYSACHRSGVTTWRT